MKREDNGEIKQEELIRQQQAMKRLNKLVKGKGLTYYITTFGCQMNAHDSEKLKGVLEEIGYTEGESEDKSDFVIYNTCCVRENAELKVYGRLGHLKKVKQKNPNLLIAICGCMMQQDVVIAELKRAYKHIDIVFGTHNLYKLAELIETRLETKETIFDIWKEHGEIVEDLPSIRKHNFKAAVNVMFGCNNFCSYCIVPYVRGRERSREAEDIIKEIKELVTDGVVEITLLGQNVNSYGKTLGEPITFAKLLQMVEGIEGLERIRFMTSHPKDLSDELIEVIKNSKKICKQLHLPFQSGSSKILKTMNRGYSKETYLALAEKVNKELPGYGLSTDIIIGFPGETEEDINDTIDVLEKVRFDSAFTFIYSKRTGTKAALMEDQIDEKVNKERFNRVLNVVNDITNEKSVAHIGGTYDVLFEEENQKREGMLTGRLSNNHLVHVKTSDDLIGKIVPVKIIDAKSFYLVGELVD